METTTSWHDILTVAIQAPSPHNTQPWRVRIVDASRAELFLDARRLIEADETGCFQVSAAGIFIEAVSLVAASRGFDVEVQLHEIVLMPGLIPIAQLTLHEAPDRAQTTINAEQLATRRTARLAHTGKMLAPNDGQVLSELSTTFGQRFAYTTDGSLIDRALARNTSAIFEDMNLPPYRNEFVGWLRTKRQSKTQRDGMALDAMRMSTMDNWVLRHAPWLLQTPGLQSVLARRYRGVLGQTDHLGWISGPFWRYHEAIKAGRFFLRLWLAFDALGMGIHPLGNLVTNRAANDWVTHGLVGEPGVWMVFRFGNTATPPKSQRLALSEVLVD